MESFDFMSRTEPIRAQMIKNMAKLIAGHAGDMARVLGISLDGYDDKCAGLLANLAMDARDSRMLKDPVQMCVEAIDSANSYGQPLSIEMQDEMAQEAMEIQQFWRGAKSMAAYDVFWNMLQTGRYPLYHGHEWHVQMARIGEALSKDKVYMDALGASESAMDGLKKINGELSPYGAGGPVSDETRKRAFDAAVSYCMALNAYRDARSEALERLGIGALDLAGVDTFHDRRANGLFDFSVLNSLISYCGISHDELDKAVNASCSGQENAG